MDELIEENMGLVISVVNSFSPKTASERDDYTQAGRIGLWKALKKYDKSRGCKLSPFAWNPIRWEIIKEIKKQKKALYCSIPNGYTSLYHMKEDFWDKIPVILQEEEKELIDLRRMGYKLAEMANITGNKIPYVKRVFYNAIKRIKEATKKSV